MAPKAPQKDAAKKPGAPGSAAANPNWEAGLARAELEEASWQPCVSLVAGSSAADELQLVQALVLAFQRPSCRLFSVLHWDKTRAMIHELGNPKTKKSDNVPQFHEVTEAAKVLLDAGQEIPCDLMAKVLKFQLLQIKAVDQQRRKAEKAEKDKVSSASLSNNKEKGGNNGTDKKRKTPPSNVEYFKEKETKLKRRDEVDPPKIKEPDDGPQHYILVLGFYQPHLISALDAIGVHVANVIKLSSEQTHSSEVQQEQQASEGSDQTPALDSESVRMEQAAQVRKLHLFWSKLRAVLDSAPLNSKLHDVAQLSYTVQNVLPSSHTQEPEAVLKLGSQVLEGVASLIFDCLVWCRQYRHYLDNLKLISVPTVDTLDAQYFKVVPAPLSGVPMTPHSKIKTVQAETLPCQETRSYPASTNVDMRHYRNLLNLVPPEACSVPLILHCMLEQVLIFTEQSDPEKLHPDEGPWLDHHLVGYMLQSFLPLVHTEQERSTMLDGLLTLVHSQKDKKRLAQTFGVETTQKFEHPLIIRHHDERALRLKDITAVEGFHPVEVESSMIRLCPVWTLIKSVSHQKNRNSCWMAIKQQLQHYCTDDAVSWPEVELMFHQSVLEAMPLTRLDQNGVLLKSVGPLAALQSAPKQTPTVIPWDNPLDFAKQQLHDLKALTKGPAFLTEDPDNSKHLSERVRSHIDLSDIQKCRLRSLFDWHFSEHHSASVFPQVLQLASEEYCCLDTLRGSHNNVLYIFCHNPMSPHRQCKESWDIALHTDVMFRKYLEHVADTISDWTREEELKRDELSPVEIAKDENTSDAAEEEGMLEPVIRQDSLKAWKLEQEGLKMEKLARKVKKEITPKDKQSAERDKLTERRTVSAIKKSRSETAVTSAKAPPRPISATAPPVEVKRELSQTEDSLKHFTGYSMDGKLVHVSGQIQHLFPTDGGCITVENVSYVEGLSLVKVAVKKDGHHFYTHINHGAVGPVTPLPHVQNEEPSDRKEDLKNKDATESVKSVDIKTMKQGSLSAVLNNGIHLSYSFYGPTGQCIVSSQEAGGEIPEFSTAVPVALSSSVQHSRKNEVALTLSKTQTTDSQMQPQEYQTAVCHYQNPLPSKPFNNLNLSVPSGLLLQFLTEETQGVSAEVRGMLVRQSFPLHDEGEVKHPLDSSLFKEISRVVTSQGAVICSMRDGSTKVLFADGSVSFSPDCGPVWVPDSEIDMISQEAEDDKKDQNSNKDSQRGFWTTTTPSGVQICTVGTTHKHRPTTPLLAYKATDPITHEVMLSREDLVVSVQNPDGSLNVEHADGTRITSFFQTRPPSTRHTLMLTGDQPENVTLKSTSECVCGCAECVCVTRCAESINENTCDTGEKISGEAAEKAYDKDSVGQACAKLREPELMCDRQGCVEISERKNTGECAFVEENVSKNGRRNSHEGEIVDESIKERVFVVEKEGCATVVMYPERHSAHVFLADGTTITGNNQGDYKVFPSDVGLMHIQSDGKCVYTSDPLVTPSPKIGTATNLPGSYTFSHADKVACDITDPNGNHFQVFEDGQVSVLSCPTPSTTNPEEGDREMTVIYGNHKEHCPRLFVVHEDGSATELLSSRAVEHLLDQACSDPTIALLKEQLPETKDEFGITILKPCPQSVWSKWLLGKQNPDITPPNLRNRSWHDFPGVEMKTTGPPIGTNMGNVFTLRGRFSSTRAKGPPVKSCPKVLEMREMYQHRQLNTSIRSAIDMRLKEYIERLMEREHHSEEIQVKDPRPEEESAHASDLLSLVLSFVEKEGKEKRTAEGIASLYTKGVEMEQSNVSEDTTIAANDGYPKRKESKWPQKLSQYRQELSEEKACRDALGEKNIVPYFHSENIPIYQDFLQHQTPDMKALSKDLPPIPKSDSAELFLKDAPQDTSQLLNTTTYKPQSSSAAGVDRSLKKRLPHPPPQISDANSLRSFSVPYKSVQSDVTGNPRKTKVRLPNSILSSKPRSEPNLQFLSLEEPVRRKCRTISLIDPNAVVRGFILLPSTVDFGTLQEGNSTAVTVVMKNVGVDTCRFHVKQPPSATGLRVIYSPGPVAAGLQVELKVQLFAMRAVQAGVVEPETHVSQDIAIHTETDILYLPVTATILSERLYELWLKDHTKRLANKRGSRLSKTVSQPSSRSGSGAR